MQTEKEKQIEDSMSVVQLFFKIIYYYIDGWWSHSKEEGGGEGTDDNDKFIVDDALKINIIHEYINRHWSLF